MIIRKAKPEDNHSLAPLLIQAMESMAFQFTKTGNKDESLKLFAYFIGQTKNIYSFENILIAVENTEITGSISAYDGSLFNELRKPFLDFIKQNYNYTVNPEEETESGEFYIDTVSVLPEHQGKGIGKKLIEKVIEKAGLLGFSRVGLLVDTENPNAKKLYQKLGFVVTDKKILMGGTYEHLVLEIHKKNL